MEDSASVEEGVAEAEASQRVASEELAERARRRQSRMPQRRVWTFILMKMNGFLYIALGAFLLLYALKAAFVLSMEYPLALTVVGFVPIFILPLSILLIGFCIYRCSKLGVLVACVFALLYMLILFFELLAYIKFARARPYDAVVPTGAYVLLFLIMLQFISAYFLSRSWRHLRWL